MLQNDNNFIKLGFTGKQRQLHSAICKIGGRKNITVPADLMQEVKLYLNSNQRYLLTLGNAYIEKACRKYCQMSAKENNPIKEKENQDG